MTTTVKEFGTMNNIKGWTFALALGGLGILLIPQSAEGWYFSTTTVASGYREWDDSDYGFYGFRDGAAFYVEVEAESWDGPTWWGTCCPSGSSGGTIRAWATYTVTAQGAGPGDQVQYDYELGPASASTIGDARSPGDFGESESRAYAYAYFYAGTSSTTNEKILSSTANLILSEYPSQTSIWETYYYFGAPPLNLTYNTGTVNGATGPHSRSQGGSVYGTTDIVSPAQGFSILIDQEASARALIDEDGASAYAHAYDTSNFGVIAVP